MAASQKKAAPGKEIAPDPALQQALFSFAGISRQRKKLFDSALSAPLR